jgi:hypothetical protein
MEASERMKKARTLGLLLLGLPALGGVGALVACNQLLGTDGYTENAEDSGPPADGSANDGSSSQDANTGDASTLDASFDGTIYLPPGANPASWPTFQMPDIVTDAAPQPSYTAAGDGGVNVIDNVTHLLWQAKSVTVPGADPGFADAKAACDAIGTKGSWRVPTRLELVSLVEHVDVAGNVTTNAKIDTAFFTVGKVVLWTSSPILPATNPPNFWLVNFKDGTLSNSKTDTALQVLCVKAK